MIGVVMIIHFLATWVCASSAFVHYVPYSSSFYVVQPSFVNLPKRSPSMLPCSPLNTRLKLSPLSFSCSVSSPYSGSLLDVETGRKKPNSRLLLFCYKSVKSPIVRKEILVFQKQPNLMQFIMYTN